MKRFLSKIFIPALLSITVVTLAIVFFARPTATVAGPNDNVVGWALSDAPNGADQDITPINFYGGRGLGWISLNSINANAGGGDYGVNLGTDGKFIGKAWSEYGGFVDFNPAGPYPDSDTANHHGASVTASCLAGTTACPITGWIRFTNGSSDPNNTQTGGWDGWVKMSGTVTGGGTYGVMLSAPVASSNRQIRTFSGQAWGDRVAGWIDFRWAQVRVLTPPGVPGCIDPLATNYNLLATEDDGSCIYPPKCPVPNPDPNYPTMNGYNNLCPCKARSGHPEDCVPPPPIKGCMISGDPYEDPNATIPDKTMCFCPNGDFNQSTGACGSCPNPNYPSSGSYDKTCKCIARPGHEKEDCPSTPKGPKKPIFIET